MSGRRSVTVGMLQSPSEPCAATHSPAQTLVKGLSLLRAFAAGEQHLGNKELADRTGLPRPTVSRLAGVLVELGYLRYSDHLGKYALGAGVLTLAYPMAAGLAIRHIARPFMKQLADEIGGQVSMGLTYGTSMVFIETSRSPRHRHSLPELGATTPILSSAMGRAYLAALSPAHRAVQIQRLRLEDPVRWAAFHERAIQAAARDYVHLGFTRSLGDSHKALHACAVPLRTRIDCEIVVVNCSVMSHTLRRGQLEDSIGPHLIATCRQIDTACGQHY